MILKNQAGSHCQLTQALPCVVQSCTSVNFFVDTRTLDALNTCICACQTVKCQPGCGLMLYQL